MLFPKPTFSLLLCIAATLPLPALARDNCTQYSSVSAGSVCLDRPSDCLATTMVQADDTCEGLADRVGNITTSMLYYLNPDIGTSCLGLRAYTPVCVAVPWYTFQPPIQPPAGTTWLATEHGEIDMPIPTAPRTNSTCAKYELVGAGVRTDTLTASNNVTFDQLSAWNPILTDYPDAWAGYWYAVSC